MTWRPDCPMMVLLLFAGLTLQGSSAAAQEKLLTRLPLDPELRARLAEGAQDSTLEPWHRAFMLEVARRGLEPAEGAPSPSLPGIALGTGGTAAGEGSWIEVPPPARFGHTAIYDPVRDRVVFFGGHDVSYSGESSGDYRDNTWALSLAGSPAWIRLAPTGTSPPARSGHTAIYDPVRDRMVVFGGDHDWNYRNDAWALSLAGSPAWTELAPTGSLPFARSEHTAIYDPVRDRMVIFGGVHFGSSLNDAWALSLAGSPAWSQLAPSGSPPSGRREHTAIYDPVRDRMVVFGGGGSNGLYFNDVWAVSLEGNLAWSQLAPTESPPSARDGHTAIYDPVRHRMVVFGGYGEGIRDDAWALTLSASLRWSQLAPGNSPAARYGHTATYDPVRDRMVVFGGRDFPNLHNDAWALSLAWSPAWSQVAPTPSARYGHTAIYDPVRDRMVVFGGRQFDNYRNDSWVLTLAGSPAWSQLAPTGSPPSARYGHTAIYDPVRDRMVVFGGWEGDRQLREVWALSLAGSPAWSQLANWGPPARYYHTAIYDPGRDRMVIFGGVGDLGNEVWAFALAGSPAWTELAPTGSPPSARRRHSAIYDPVRDRMVVFGGVGEGYYDDAWALSLAGSPAWSQLASFPSRRRGHKAIYDPVRDRMVVFGGDDVGALRRDAWALSLAGSPAWTELAPMESPPSARYHHTAIYDPVRDRMVVFGGSSGSGHLGDAWALEWSAHAVSVAESSVLPRRFDLAPPRPNPSRGQVTLELALSQSANVSLAVYDVAGRFVRTLVDGPTAPGRHSIVWDTRDRSGRGVTPGVYLVRFTAPGARLVRKAIILQTRSGP